MLNLGEILLVIGSAMVKFLFAPWIAYMLDGKFGGAVLWSFVGGCLGTLVFYRISAWLMERARLRAVRKQLASGIRTKIFTRFNKFVVRMKRGHGLLGIVAVLPFISIPVGSVLAAKYFKHDRRTIPALIGSVAVWSVLLSVFWRIGQ